MTSKKNVKILSVLCIVAILAIAICGCEDLGAYEDTEEYYETFGDIVFIEGTSREVEEYSVEDYFYNKESREDFLEGADGVYKGVEHSDYVYMAIPLEGDIDMDSLAFYIQALEDVTVYINVYVVDAIPTEWKAIADNILNSEDENEVDPDADQSDSEEKKYDDPDYETRIGEVIVHLTKERWSSFVLDTFNVDGVGQKSIKI